MKRIIVGCECSGIVRRAFAARGWDAWSCDLKPAEDGSDHHYQCDIRDVLGLGWNRMIVHPDCTYLTVSGLHWNSRDATGERAKKTDESLEFVRMLLEYPIDEICLENPVGCISSRIRKPDQIVQPYQFGDDASKKTCLWLKGLPKLTINPASRFPGRRVEWPRGSGKIVERWSNQTDSGQSNLGPSEDRKANRARTYQGIADAMADQWK